MGEETKPEVDLSSVSIEALTAELEKRFRATEAAQKRLGVHLGLADTVTPRPRLPKSPSQDLRKTQPKSPTWYQAQHSRHYHTASARHDQKRMDAHLAELKKLGLPLLPKKKKGSQG
jgi:hypothetical protein